MPPSDCPPELLVVPPLLPEEPLDELLMPPDDPPDEPLVPLEEPVVPLDEPLPDPPPLELDPPRSAQSLPQCTDVQENNLSPSVHAPPEQPQSPAHLSASSTLSKQPA